MNRYLFSALELNYPSRIGQSCFVSATAMFAAYPKDLFKVPNWDNHGVIMKYNPLNQRYLIECTGINDWDGAWFERDDLDFYENN